MIIPELIGKALRNINFRMTKGQQRRCFVFVGDVARFLLKIGTHLASGGNVPLLVNAPACRPISIVELARRLMAVLGNPVELQVGTLSQRKNELMEAWPDSALAESMNLITLTPLEKGLAATAAWYRENEWFTASMPLEE